MVRFQTKMDSVGKIYKAGTKISDILASLEVIAADLRLQLATEEETEK